MIRFNTTYRELLSNDLGAVGALLVDIGCGRYAPPPGDDDAARAAWETDLARVREGGLRSVDRNGDRTHTKIQTWLRDLGIALGFWVHVAANDRGRTTASGCRGDGCRGELPVSLEQGPVATQSA